MSEIAKYIEHTLLTPYATEKDISRFCDEAVQHKFVAVCIPPYWVSFAAKRLASHPQIEVCTPIGFPLGFNAPGIKALEAKAAVEQGATEIDMVINIGALKEKNLDVVSSEIKEVLSAASGRIVKVIIETGHLTKDEIVLASKLVLSSGAHFIKTCTGYTPIGATVENIRLIRDTVGDQLRIKASSKIRDYQTAAALVKAGADRLGVVQSLKILEEEQAYLNRQ